MSKLLDLDKGGVIVPVCIIVRIMKPRGASSQVSIDYYLLKAYMMDRPSRLWDRHGSRVNSPHERSTVPVFTSETPLRGTRRATRSKLWHLPVFFFL